jgi:hypothetical protein
VKTAKLPIEARDEKPRALSELVIGETGNVSLAGLIVTEDHDCYLDSKQPLQKPCLLQMVVSRNEEGFHVVLPSAPKFTGVPLFNERDLLPIASITTSKDKWSPGYRDALS